MMIENKDSNDYANMQPANLGSRMQLIVIKIFVCFSLFNNTGVVPTDERHLHLERILQLRPVVSSRNKLYSTAYHVRNINWMLKRAANV